MRATARKNGALRSTCVFRQRITICLIAVKPVAVYWLLIVTLAGCEPPGGAAERPADSALSQFSPDQVVLRFARNAVEADNAFNGKWVRIAGIVALVERGAAGKPVVMLAGGDPPSVVLCELPASESARASSWRAGDTLTLSGRCIGRMNGVPAFVDCRPAR